MKRTANLGKSLDKLQQAKIAGGNTAFTAFLHCQYTYGGSWILIETYGNQEECMANINTYCNDTGVYEACTCNGGANSQYCWL